MKKHQGDDIMKKMLIAKANALVNASYTLDLGEKRLILLAIMEARNTGRGINIGDNLYIHASRYAEIYETDISSAYEALQHASRNLFSRQFSFKELNKRGNIEEVSARWVNEIRYVKNEAVVAIEFSKAIIPLITDLTSKFTQYDIREISKFTSIYAIRLWELITSWESVGHTPIYDINDLRKKLGLTNQYKTTSEFKRNVILIAINQINNFSSFTVEYEQHKSGRLVTGINFIIKKQANIKTVSTEIKLSDAQRNIYSKKLSEMPEMSKYSHGTESYQQFAVRIAEMLRDPKKVAEFLPPLKRVGFKQ